MRVAPANGSEGGDSERSSYLNHPYYYFYPGKVRPSSLDELNLDIMPLTDQLRAKYHLNGQMRLVTILMVVKVEFADGTTYDATPTFESLKKFFTENSIPSEKEEVRKKQP